MLALSIHERRRLPEPSAPKRGEHLIAPSSLIAAKAALFMALGRSGLTQRELARRMKVDVSQVARLLDPRHRSRMDQIDRALKALGAKLVLGLDAAA